MQLHAGGALPASAQKQWRVEGVDIQMKCRLLPFLKSIFSFAAHQADGVTKKIEIGALGHSSSCRFLAGEGDQCLPAALAA